MSYTGSVPDTSRASDWREHAECARPEHANHRDIWFADVRDREEAAGAKTVCQGCPVRRACLAAALREEGGAALDRRFGIRGGLTGAQRLVIYRRRAASERATVPAGVVVPPQKKRQPAACGTRPGYQKHLREKTTICAPCRQANTDADNRLRRTGTMKVTP